MARSSSTGTQQSWPGPPPPTFPNLPALQNRMGPLADSCMVCKKEITAHQHMLRHVADNCQGGIHTRCMRNANSFCPGCKKDISKKPLSNLTTKSATSSRARDSTTETSTENRQDGWHSARERQKQYFTKDEYYKLPGYKAQEVYSIAIQEAGKRRWKAESELQSFVRWFHNLQAQILRQREKTADQEYRRIYHGVQAFTDNSLRAHLQHVENLQTHHSNLPHLPYEIHRAYLEFRKIDYEQRAILANAQIRRDKAIEQARLWSMQGTTIAEQEWAKERHQILDNWRVQLQAARIKLVEAHKNDRATSALWELHPPDPLLNKAAVERNERRVYFE